MTKTISTFFIVLLITETFLMATFSIEVNATTAPEAIGNVKEVFAGPRNNMMFLLEDNTLFAGGTHISKGQLGTPTTSSKLAATEQVNLSNVLGKVVKVEIGYDYSMLLDDKGYVYTTGHNNYGQLGMGNTTDLTVFTRVPLPEEVFITDITAGAQTAYALTSNKELYGWGGGGHGALIKGNPSDTYAKNSTLTPTVIATNILKVSASKSDGAESTTHYNSLYVVKEDGNLYVCGYNASGQLGTGDTTHLTTLTNAEFFNDKKIEQIQAANARVFVLLDNGEAYVTGDNYYGSLGINGSKNDAKTPGTDVGIGDLKTWAPMVIPNAYTIEKFFRCGSTQMYQLSDGQVWATGSNDDGDLGFYAKDNTWHPVSDIGPNKFLMTNICTLEQTDLYGNLRTLNPTAGGGGTAEQNHTDLSIYNIGSDEEPVYVPIKSLSGGYNECFMVDANGYLRVSADTADADTSTVAYAPDKAINPSTRQFHRMQAARRTIRDPEIIFQGHKNTITILISGVEEEVAINPTEIIMGPKQSDTAPVYEKYILYKYDTSTGVKGKAVITSTTTNAAHLVTDSPLSLNLTDQNLEPGDYIIEVYRSSTIPKGETGAGVALESNHITKIFSIAENVTLTYDPNTGIGDAPSEPTEYGKNSNVPVLNNTYTKEGHSFVNWNTSLDGLGTTYNPGDILKIQEDTILYAQWALSPSYDNRVEITGELFKDNEKIFNIPRLNSGTFKNIEPEISVILRNTQSGKEYIGILKYIENEKLIYRNIEYGEYEVFCITPSDMKFKNTDISENKFTITSENSTKEIIINSTFIELKGFGNIHEKNDISLIE